MIVFKTVDDKLKVVAKEMSHVESVSVIVWIKTGSRYEPKELNGISHLIEHMVFKGSKKRDNALKISLAIEEIGGKINAFTSEEYTGFYVKVPANYLSLGLDVLSDMIFNPLLREEDLAKEKKVVMEEIKRYYDIPEEWVETLLTKAVWGDHPLGRDILGTIESVSGITKKDIEDFMKKYYAPYNITLSIAGKISFEEIFKLSKDYFLIDRDGVPSNFLKADDKIQGDKFIIEHRKINQTHLSMAFLSFPRGDKKRYALSLMSIILGSGMSSRLFQRLREEKGLVYDISTYPVYFTDTGIFKIGAGIDPKRTKEAIYAIQEELQKMKEFHNEKELRKAKEYYKGSFLISLEDSLTQSSFVGKWTMLEGNPPDISEFIEQTERVTTDDVRELANTIFTYEREAASIIFPEDLHLDHKELFFKDL